MVLYIRFLNSNPVFVGLRHASLPAFLEAGPVRTQKGPSGPTAPESLKQGCYFIGSLHDTSPLYMLPPLSGIKADISLMSAICGPEFGRKLDLKSAIVMKNVILNPGMLNLAPGQVERRTTLISRGWAPVRVDSDAPPTAMASNKGVDCLLKSDQALQVGAYWA